MCSTLAPCNFHLVKNTFSPVGVKGTHYWKYICFPGGLNKWRVRITRAPTDVDFTKPTTHNIESLTHWAMARGTQVPFAAMNMLYFPWSVLKGIWPWVKAEIVPTVNIPIQPLKWVLRCVVVLQNGTIGFDHHSHLSPLGRCSHLGVGQT